MIIIDQHLPDGGALRAVNMIKEVKSVNQTVPIVAMSFDPYFLGYEKFDFVLKKPFSAEDVDNLFKESHLLVAS